MTDLNGIQPAFSGQQGGTPQQSTGAPTAKLSSDFETFLKMLTVQMQNQDPLNPVESSEYAVQLATFSAVEQQVLTNDLLERLVGQAGGGLSQMAAWVGMEVRTPGAASFDGTSITVWAEPVTGADMASLIVRDSYGNEIARQPVALEGGRVDWTGQSASGQPALLGDYTFEIESTAAGEVIAQTPAQVYAQVIEARLEPQGVMLVTTAGQEVSAVSVTALRQP